MPYELFSNIMDFNHKLLETVQSMRPIRLGGIEVNIEVLHNTYDMKPLNTGQHKHPFYELSMMSRGSMEYILEDITVEISSGKHDIVFIPPETVHSRIERCLNPSVITGFQIQVNAVDKKYKRFIEALPEELRKNRYHFSGSSSDTDIIGKALEELYESRPFYKERTALLISEFFINFFREQFQEPLKQLEKSNQTKDSDHSFHENLLSLACRYVEEHIARQIRIDEIGLYCGLSKRHLNRIFTERKGISLGNYVIHRKIDEARKRIMRNDKLIKDIAYELGFRNISYFCRLFRKITGKSPESYREMR